MFADNIALIVDSKESMNKKVPSLTNALQKIELRKNSIKTKTLMIRNNVIISNVDIKIENTKL